VVICALLPLRPVQVPSCTLSGSPGSKLLRRRLVARQAAPLFPSMPSTIERGLPSKAPNPPGARPSGGPSASPNFRVHLGVSPVAPEQQSKLGACGGIYLGAEQRRVLSPSAGPGASPSAGWLYRAPVRVCRQALCADGSLITARCCAWRWTLVPALVLFPISGLPV
jgi:hypothetical protein